jgi:hypothetical protein
MEGRDISQPRSAAELKSEVHVDHLTHLGAKVLKDVVEGVLHDGRREGSIPRLQYDLMAF